MSRLEKLRELEEEIRELMKKANSRTYASLARQYRETLKEIDEIEGGTDDSDEIAALLQRRDNTGKAGAVRKNISKISRD